MNQEWKGETRVFHFDRDIPKESIFVRIDTEHE